MAHHVNLAQLDELLPGAGFSVKGLELECLEHPRTVLEADDIKELGLRATLA